MSKGFLLVVVEILVFFIGLWGLYFFKINRLVELVFLSFIVVPTFHVILEIAALLVCRIFHIFSHDYISSYMLNSDSSLRERPLDLSIRSPDFDRDYPLDLN